MSRAKTLTCGSKTLDLSRPAVMGILNVTPDSFSDGGQLYAGEQIDLDKTLQSVESMLEQGADIIDIGGESTRPGASPVSVQQELDRAMREKRKLSIHRDPWLGVI